MQYSSALCTAGMFVVTSLTAGHAPLPSPGLLGVWPALLPQPPQLLQVPRSLLAQVQVQVQVQVLV